MGARIKTNRRYRNGQWLMRVEILVPAATLSREERLGKSNVLFTRKNVKS
jgi:hypothetical protein